MARRAKSIIGEGGVQPGVAAGTGAIPNCSLSDVSSRLEFRTLFPEIVESMTGPVSAHWDLMSASTITSTRAASLVQLVGIEPSTLQVIIPAQDDSYLVYRPTGPATTVEDVIERFTATVNPDSSLIARIGRRHQATEIARAVRAENERSS